ncbi:MAG: sugar ABC transporter ATP-binding protein [Planctomycetales bacterium]|nr:sugar ABC transporter ATP-binding protein [Planctomycetales bacterium]
MRDIRKSFGATRALDGVDLTVSAGTVHGLIGENGAGKSTLMKVLSGAIHPDSGHMQLDGVSYTPAHPRAGRTAGVAMIYQELSLAPHLTVMENILLGAEPVWGPFLRRRQMETTARQALADIGRSDLSVYAKVGSLSQADQQLVEIARSVAIGCRVLVLDEPTSSITARDVARLFALIHRLREKGLGIVYISHFLEEIRQLCDDYTVLRDGRTVGSGKVADTTNDDIVRMMVGRQVNDLYPRTARAPGETLLRVTEVAGLRMPRNASLELRRGEVLGIAGLIGSGRTELMRAIFGLDPVASGKVRVAHGLTSTPHNNWQHGVGMVSEDRKNEGLALGQSIAENLTLPRLDGLGPGRLVFPGRQQRVSDWWVQQLQVRCRDSAQKVGDLSGGNQQKVAVARLLHADVDCLLLDEPTRGIDVGSKAQIYQLIDNLVAANRPDGEPAKAVLMISSYLPELLGVCDRIAVMNRGVLNPPRAARDWDEHGIMREATQGELTPDAVSAQQDHINAVDDSVQE